MRCVDKSSHEMYNARIALTHYSGYFLIHYDELLLVGKQVFVYMSDVSRTHVCLCRREIPFHCPSWQTARSSMHRTHKPFLQPPGGTGRAQNQSNHGHDGDALERGAIAEIRLANTGRHCTAKVANLFALLLVG